jgi:hypothetical protein
MGQIASLVFKLNFYFFIFTYYSHQLHARSYSCYFYFCIEKISKVEFFEEKRNIL